MELPRERPRPRPGERQGTGLCAAPVVDRTRDDAGGSFAHTGRLGRHCCVCDLVRDARSRELQPLPRRKRLRIQLDLGHFRHRRERRRVAGPIGTITSQIAGLTRPKTVSSRTRSTFTAASLIERLSALWLRFEAPNRWRRRSCASIPPRAERVNFESASPSARRAMPYLQPSGDPQPPPPPSRSDLSTDTRRK